MKSAYFLILTLLLFSTQSEAQNRIGGKLEQIVIPSVDFSETPFSDAVQFIQTKSVELDPEKEGINIVVLDPGLAKKNVTLRLKNVPLGEVLRYLTLLGGGELSAATHAVTITGPTDKPKSLPTHKPGAIQTKIRRTIIPSVEFADTPFIDAMEFLVLKSSELDPTGKGGINMVYKGDRENAQQPIFLRLSKIPLSEALKYTVQLGNHRMKVETHAILVESRVKTGKKAEVDAQ